MIGWVRLCRLVSSTLDEATPSGTGRPSSSVHSAMQGSPAKGSTVPPGSLSRGAEEMAGMGHEGTDGMGAGARARVVRCLWEPSWDGGSGAGDGQDLRAVLGDGHRVLDVRGPAAVAAADRPAAGVTLVPVPAAGQEPGLDGDDQPGDELAAAAGRALVGNGRVLVHGPADAVTAEVGTDSVAGGAADGGGGGGDVPDPRARDGRGDARPQGFP